MTVALLLVGFLGLPQSPAWDELRASMVQRTIAEPRDGRPAVSDPAVLRAMRTVDRHRLVPERLRDASYDDTPLPIGYRQTISQPYIVALMTELLEPEEDDVILEVGTGSGYQAAVLAEIVRHVYTIEIVEPLAERARRDLRALGYDNVTVHAGDGYVGWPAHAPFDGILVAAAPDHIPQPLIDQLKVGARLVLPVGAAARGQELVTLEKRADGTLERTSVLAVRFVPLTGERARSAPPDR